MKLKPESFKRWLESFPPEKIVGSAFHPFDNPLAHWLTSMMLAGEIQYSGSPCVSRRYYRFWPWERRYKLPRWMALFVDRIRAKCRKEDDEYGSVTAADALRALDEVVHELIRRRDHD